MTELSPTAILTSAGGGGIGSVTAAGVDPVPPWMWEPSRASRWPGARRAGDGSITVRCTASQLEVQWSACATSYVGVCPHTRWAAPSCTKSERPTVLACRTAAARAVHGSSLTRASSFVRTVLVLRRVVTTS